MLPFSCRCYLWSMLFALNACAVQPGKIPAGTAEQRPEAVERTRGEVKSTLSSLHESVAMVGRVQSVIQRGLADHQIDAGSTLPANLLEASEGDNLNFDAQHPERFSYRLNNSTSFNLATKSGGTIQVLLAGQLDDASDKKVIKDAKLDVNFDKAGDHRVFHVLFQKKVDDQGEDTTEWSMDLRQLSELYRSMSGEDEGVAAFSGVLELRLSASKAHVNAKDFTLVQGDVRVYFEQVQLDLVRNHDRAAPRSATAAIVKGYVEQGGQRRGTFTLNQGSGQANAEFSLNLAIK